jgi:hypothetical protein
MASESYIYIIFVIDISLHGVNILADAILSLPLLQEVFITRMFGSVMHNYAKLFHHRSYQQQLYLLFATSIILLGYHSLIVSKIAAETIALTCCYDYNSYHYVTMTFIK